MGNKVYQDFGELKSMRNTLTDSQSNNILSHRARKQTPLSQCSLYVLQLLFKAKSLAKAKLIERDFSLFVNQRDKLPSLNQIPFLKIHCNHNHYIIVLHGKGKESFFHFLNDTVMSIFKSSTKE